MDDIANVQDVPLDPDILRYQNCVGPSITEAIRLLGAGLLSF